MKKMLLFLALLTLVAGCGHPVTIGLIAWLSQGDEDDDGVVMPAKLSVRTSTLPYAVNGVAYNTGLSAAGGKAPYNWSVIAGAPPAGITLDAGTGVLSGTPGAAVTDYTFTVEVLDSKSASATRQLTITLYDQLTFTFTPPLPDATLNTPYGPVAITAAGGTGNYTWSMVSGALPSGMTFNTATGEVGGTPNDATGTYAFSVTVSDDAVPPQTAGPLNLTLDLYDVLTITTPTPLPYAINGVAYSQTLSAGGGSAPYSNWTIVSGTQPSPLTLNTSTGELSGTPVDTAGIFTFTVEVTDSAVDTATKQFTMTLYDELQITYAGPLPDGISGQSYGPETVTATGGTGNITWSLSAGALPSGVTLTTDSGDIQGIPTETGAFPITVMVQDDASPPQTDTIDLTLNVYDTLSITTTTLPYAINGVAYSEVLNATGGTGTYNWSESGGPALPTGLSITAGGLVDGTPGATTGLYNFTAQVDDDATPPQSDTQGLSIQVYDQLTITTSSPLPSALLNQAYNQTLVATGGTGIYSWTEVTTELATYGLSLSAAGVITGTATQEGTCSFTVEVQDDESPAQVVQKGFTLVVSDLVADFTASPTVGEISFDVDFTNLSLGSVTSWEWDFGDGSPLDTTNWDTSHTYTTAGWYTVTLTINTATESATCIKVDYILAANNIWYVDDAIGTSVDGTTWTQAFLTIQEGLTAAAAGDYNLVLVADGTYAGDVNNRGLDFGGAATYLKAEDYHGSSIWIIDCGGLDRGFDFQNGEGNDSVVDSFTIQNGHANPGGGIRCDGASPTIINCTITNNTCDAGGGPGGADRGGGVHCQGGAAPVIVNCVITGNLTGGGGNDLGGGCCCTGGGTAPIITNCDISGNTAGGQGGGIYCAGGADPVVTNCTVTGNSVDDLGGGIFCEGNGTNPEITGCLIANNSATAGASAGGGVCVQGGSDPVVTNCTIANNSSDWGGGIYLRQNGSSVVLNNTIIWGNTAVPGQGFQIRARDNTTLTLDHCDYADGANDTQVEVSVTLNLIACINSNPAFVAAGSGDFRLQGTSPCINTGSDALVPVGVDTDLDGNPRKVGTVDMGAYEYQ